MIIVIEHEEMHTHFCQEMNKQKTEHHVEKLRDQLLIPSDSEIDFHKIFFIVFDHKYLFSVKCIGWISFSLT